MGKKGNFFVGKEMPLSSQYPIAEAILDPLYQRPEYPWETTRSQPMPSCPQRWAPDETGHFGELCLRF